MYPAFHEDHKVEPQSGRDGPIRYWSSMDPDVAKVVQTMDEADTWSLEDETVIRQSLDKLIERLSASERLRHYSLQYPEKVVELLGWMRTSSAMMLLHFSADERRETLDRFIEVCTAILQDNTNDDYVQRAASIAIDRFLAFERLAMLRRLFSAERAEGIEKAVHSAVSLINAESGN